MTIEAALIKPVVDAILGLFREGEHLRLQHNAEAALREAIRELLLANPNENKAEARIAIAKAAGILSEDIVLAEEMLEKHRAAKTRTAGKHQSGRRKAATESRSAPAAKSQAKTSASRARKSSPPASATAGEETA